MPDKDELPSIDEFGERLKKCGHCQAEGWIVPLIADGSP